MGTPQASTRSSCVCTCRVPLQYLTNTVHWRELVLAVGPGVLIPRPETELLIDFAQQVSFQPGLGSAGWCCSACGQSYLELCRPQGGCVEA